MTDDRFKTLLDASVKAHGHFCPGQVLGVRMAMLGLSLLGFEAPLDNSNIKKVVVYAEIDRCATDALTTATGVKLGRRSLKFVDYGLMAATFVNLETGRAFRVEVKDASRRKAAGMFPDIAEAHEREGQAYQVLPASDLFSVTEVNVDIPPEDLPGHGSKTVCQGCGSVVANGREIMVDGRPLCAVCAGRAYFTTIARVDDLDSLDPVG